MQDLKIMSWMEAEHSSNGLRPSVRHGAGSNMVSEGFLRLIKAKTITGAMPWQLFF